MTMQRRGRFVTEPVVSIFIRVRDEADSLGEVFRSLAEQDFSGPTECVVLDNQSSDASAKTALDAGARVFTLPRENFGYGRALNLGLELCRGEVVVFLSAHSIPQQQNWLSQFVNPLLTGVADAAYCNQIPVSSASRTERQRFREFPSGDTLIHRDLFLDRCAQGADPYDVAQFSNSASAVSRSRARELPFRDLSYAEDRAFAVDLLMAGGTVAFVHSVSVSYRRLWTWKSAYSAAYRAQVSKRLIRELAATYTGRRISSVPEAIGRLIRVLAIPATVTYGFALAMTEPSRIRRNSSRDVAVATGATLGIAHGCLKWRLELELLSVDAHAFDLARHGCKPIGSE